MVSLKAFGSGCVNTLIFSQGVFTLPHLAGPTPANSTMAPAKPLGHPAVLSQPLRGDVWGLGVALVMRALHKSTFEALL